MDEVTLAIQSYQLAMKDLGLVEEIELKEAQNAFDRLEEYLINQVNQLLDNDFNGLLNALYRIDISENRVKEILHDSSSELLASNIAKAIIEREKQKVITRLKYQS